MVGSHGWGGGINVVGAHFLSLMHWALAFLLSAAHVGVGRVSSIDGKIQALSGFALCSCLVYQEYCLFKYGRRWQFYWMWGLVEKLMTRVMAGCNFEIKRTRIK